MKIRSVLLLLCAMLVFGASAIVKAAQPYTLHYEVKVQSKAFGDMGTRKLWLKGDKLRWEANSANLPLQIVSNGKGVFLIHPWNKIAAKYPKESKRGNPLSLMPGPTCSPSKFLKSMKAKKVGQEKVGKEVCNVYTYTEPINKIKCKLWVNAKTGKPEKLQMTAPGDNADTVTATYTKFEENVKVADSLFELPKDYKIRDMPDRSETKTNKKTASKKSS